MMLGRLVALVGVAVLWVVGREEGRRLKVIAHRGGSIVYPQSSAAAYRERVRLKDADFLECDLGVTSDGILVCQHEPDLTRSSDAELRMALPEKDLRTEWLDPVLDFVMSEKDDTTCEASNTLAFMREDARPSRGWYTPDYVWKETIYGLNAPCAYHQRCLDYNTTHYPVATLEDLWSLAEETNVGLYLEIKHATWLKSRRNIDLLAHLVSYIENKRRPSNAQRLPTCTSNDQSRQSPEKCSEEEFAGFDSDSYLPTRASKSDVRVPNSTSDRKANFPIYLQSFEITDLMRLRQHFGYNSNISLVALVTTLHTTFRLPSDCCVENKELKEKLTPFANQPFFRLPGCVGEMFYSSSFCDPQDRSCQNPLHGLQIHPVAVKHPKHQLDKLGALDADNTSRCSNRRSRRFLHHQVHDQIHDQIHDLSCLVDSLGLDLRLLRAHPEIAQELASANIPLHVWTVRTPSDMKFIAKLPVDGVITDDAAMSMRFLGRYNRSVPK